MANTITTQADVANVLAAIKSATAQNSQYEATQASLSTQTADILNALSKNSPVLGDENNVTPAALAESNMYKAGASNQANAFAAAAGLVGDKNIMLSIGNKMQEALLKTEITGKQLDEIESMSFFDNPLAWISNQIIPNKAYAEHNSAVHEFNRLDKGATALNNLAQEYALTSQSTVPGTTVETQRGITQAAINQLAHKNAALNIESIKHNSAAMGSLIAANQYTLQGELHKYSAKQEYDRLVLSAEANDKAAAAVAEGSVEDDALLDAYLLGHEILMGKAAAPVDKKTLTMWMRNPAMYPAAGEFIRKGLSVAGLDPSNELYGAYGPTPGDAWVTLNATRATLVPAAMNTVEKLIYPVSQVLLNDPEVAKQYKTPEQKKQFINEQVAIKVAEFNKVVDDKITNNPFVIPSIASLAKPDPSSPLTATGHKIVTGTELYKKVLSPAITAGLLQKTSHQELFDVVVAGVKSGKISNDVAAVELATIVSYATTINARKNQFLRMGIQTPSTYNAALVLYNFKEEANAAAVTAAGVAPAVALTGVGAPAAFGAATIVTGVAGMNVNDIVTKTKVFDLRSANSVKAALLASGKGVPTQMLDSIKNLFAPKKGK